MAKSISRIVCAIAVQAILAGCEAPAEMPQPDEVLQSKPVGEEHPSEQSHEPGLQLYVNDFRLVYDDPDEFVLDVYFENLGEHSVVVLPSKIHRQYRPLDRTTATYVPYPGPRISPWKEAFTLMPRETRVVHLAGMRDGDGVWALDYGNYQLSLTYFVTEDLAANGAAFQQERGSPNAPVWVGELHSRPIAVRYELTEQPGQLN